MRALCSYLLSDRRRSSGTIALKRDPGTVVLPLMHASTRHVVAKDCCLQTNGVMMINCLLSARVRFMCGLVAVLALVLLPPATAAPIYRIVTLGLNDLEHTRNDDYKSSVASQLNEAGHVRGYSLRYNGGSVDFGQSAWLYNGANTINIGLTGVEHTKNDDYKYSSSLQLNEAGKVVGYSSRYNGGSTDLGRSAWLYDDSTLDIGFTGAEHTRSDGYKFSSPDELNEAGQVRGFSQRYNGGSTLLGWSVWLYDGVTTHDIGLTDGEHTRNDGYKNSFADHLNAAGYVVGNSNRYNGGSSNLGRSVWLFNGVTTLDIGLTGSEHTSSNGFKSSEFQQMNEAGQVRGFSQRYIGGNTNLGRSAWLYDGANTLDIGLAGSVYTRSDGYEYSVSVQMNEAGQVVGHSDRFNPNSIGLDKSAWLYNGSTTVEIGLVGPEHTRSDNGKSSTVTELNESGHVIGYSFRYNGGSVGLGRSVWLYNGATTIDIGFTGSEYTRNDGEKFSATRQLNEAGQVIGQSRLFYGGSSDSLGQTAWLYDGTATIRLGFTDTAYTGAGGRKYSLAEDLNEAGQVIGYSHIFGGGLVAYGRSAWLYNGVATIDIGLTDSEHTGEYDRKASVASQLNEAGRVRGNSQRYNGGSTDLGRSAWFYDGTTTINIGLTGSQHTRDDGYKYSVDEQMNEKGQVLGYAERFNGGGTFLGRDAWFYDPMLDQTFQLQLSTRSDGYAFSSATYLGDDGLTLGTYSLFDTLDNFLGSRLFYFTIADGIHDLGSLVDGGLEANGWDSLANYIRANLRGQILGQGKLHSQTSGQMAYLLTPAVPEPSTLLLALAALTGLQLAVVRRRS